MTRFRWDKPRSTEGEVSWRVQNLSLFGKSSIKKSIFSKLTIWEWNIPISIDIYSCDEGCMDGVWRSEHARTLLIRSFWAYLTEIWSLSPRYICSLFNIFARLRFRDHHPTYFGTGKCPFLLSVPGWWIAPPRKGLRNRLAWYRERHQAHRHLCSQLPAVVDQYQK